VILAAIDIGSNAVRLLISQATPDKNGGVFYTKLNLVRVPLRLGMDVFSNGIISPDKTRIFIDTMKAFKLLMDVYGVEHYKAYATSAMRDATNSAELVNAAEAKAGIKIKIISGREESGVIYETHFAQTLNHNHTYLYIDVGGGSTELSLFKNNSIQFSESFNIGTIRLLRNSVRRAQWDALKLCVKSQTQNSAKLKAIGSGGNINKIFALSKQKEGAPLSLEYLKNRHRELRGLTVDERMHRYNIRQDRADVIVPALRIYTSIMRWSGISEIYVPKIGIADGILRLLYEEYQ
jgi:exopolyphosphatase/guanosine-5'-triphosphate,3'-diphosphate pyrophosphatase